ncbi:carbohydrate porin [Gracilimonas mengyeensis]|uniref:Porin n=1 Tax=Gracilimonas mengyeensis TaxID=1302730 RepID=A0A521BJ20_9BACT|nr:carbohydrate porin [Gracilimonas mengyeensis]SMO47157.1 porin [Gracilimonas mengyeensis]
MDVRKHGHILIICALFFSWTQNCNAQASGSPPGSDNPFSLSATYIGDLFGNVAGGEEQGIRYFDNIDINLEVDLEKLGSPVLSGTTVYAYGLGNQGGSISELAGDVQGVSNIEAETSWRLYEVWAQKKFFLLNSSLLMGLYDINSEFNYLQSSQLFLNSSHGLDPTIALSGTLGPSTFPHTSMGARLKLNPWRGLVWQAALLDGVPSDPGNTRGTKIKFREDDGLFLITELSLHSVDQDKLHLRGQKRRLSNYLGREVDADNSIGIGGWMYTDKRDSWRPNGQKNYEYGIYALGEYKFADKDNQWPEAHFFSRVGMSNPSVSELSFFGGGGVALSGVLQSNKKDVVGFAVAYTQSSTNYREQVLISGQTPEMAETNYEWTYRFQLHPYIQLQADVQYVVNPGFDAELSNAWIFGLRNIISF